MRTGIAGFALAAVFVLQPEFMAAQEKTPAPKLIISMQGVMVTEEELNRAAAAELEKLELQKLQFEGNYERNRHQTLEKTLDRLVEEKLIGAEAARQGITGAQLLAGEVNKSVKDPTAQEINSFYEANKASINVPLQQVTPQIQQYLKQQNLAKARSEFIERLKKAGGVSYAVEPFRSRLETAGFPAQGPAGAAVTILEFSDFQCTYCKSVNTTLERLMKDFASDVRLVYRQFPLNDIHPFAQKAAEASLCAAEQDKFWPMHDLLFQEQGSLGVPDLKAKAARLNLNAAAFGSCLDSNRYVEKIRQDVRDGSRMGVSGTPALFINGRFLNGARPYEEIAAVIKDELGRKNSARTP